MRASRPMAFLCALFFCVASGAQGTYPERPITVIVPFAPGGIDGLVRLIGAKASAILGQPFVYKHQPGAGTRIGTETLARSPKDGYTIGTVVVGGLVVGPALVANLAYDPHADFTPIALVLDGPYLYTAHPGAGLRTLQQLVERAKAAPGQLRFGSSGVASGGHLAMEQFMAAAGLTMVHVPYKGEAPLQADLVSGQIDVAVNNTSALPLVEAGKLMLLGVSSERRVAALPHVPTAIESGVPAASSGWLGFAAPAHIADDVRARLIDAFVRAARDPEVLAAFTKAAVEPRELTGDAFAARVRRELDQLRELNKTLRIAME